MASLAASIRSFGWSTATRATSSSSKSRPITAATRSASFVVSLSRSRRRPTTSRTPCGIWSSARLAPPVSLPSLARSRTTSPTKKRVAVGLLLHGVGEAERRGGTGAHFDVALDGTG